MPLQGCVTPFDGDWIGKKETELRDENDRKLDIIMDTGTDMISNRAEAIALLLSFVDAHAEQFVDFANAMIF
jgi:hypothetical protein